MDNFTHYWLAQKNLASQGQSSFSQFTPKQNSKCVHAWEEYKKLDTAYHDLRREYLTLRAEQSSDNSNEFKNVTKGWLEKMRELRGRCLGVKDIFHNIKEKYNFIKLKSSEKIMGDQFYGPEEIENAFGFPVDIEKIPKIPYSQEELKKAKELGERLILRINEDYQGNPMTIENIGNHIAKIRKTNTAHIFDFFWDEMHDDKDEIAKQSLRMEWKLVSRQTLAGSTEMNYFGQTQILRDYLLSVGSLSPEEAEECSDENLAKIHWDDAKKLVSLQINQNHRRSLVEALYDSYLIIPSLSDSELKEFEMADDEWTNTINNMEVPFMFHMMNDYQPHVSWIRAFATQEDLGVIYVR